MHNSLLLYVSGVFSAAHELKMEWVVVKGISGYADGTEERKLANICKCNSSFSCCQHSKGMQYF